MVVSVWLKLGAGRILCKLSVAKSGSFPTSMSIYLVRLCFKPKTHFLSTARLSRTYLQYSTASSKLQTDPYGLPIQPTWSVNDLLSSYPTPTLTPFTLKRLHELSALIPPAEGTLEHDTLKREMEDLVKLVEAVKLVDVGDESGSDGQIPDGRVWAEGTGVGPVDVQAKPDGDVTGSELLRFASRTSNGLFVVDADRTK